VQFADVLGRFAQVSEEADGGYLALCPAHSDTRPSLRIWRGDDNKVRLTCRSGCATVAVINSVGLEWVDLFNVAGGGLTVPKERPALVGPGPTAALAQYVDETSALLHDFSSMEAARARAYLYARFGMGGEAASDLGVGFSGRAQMPYLTRAFTMFPRLTVPLRDFRGVARGLQGRDLTGECPGRWVGLKNPEGSRWAPYGVFRGQGGYGVTLVTEGPGDGLTGVSVGYDVVMVRGAALAGSPELLAELAEGLKGTLVIACGDNDESGMRFNLALSDGLKPYGVTVHQLRIPDHGPKTDLTAWREAGPAEFPAELHTAVKAARPVKDASEEHAESLSADLDERTGVVSVDSNQGRAALETLKSLAAQYGETADVLNAAALVAWTEGRIKYAPGLGYYVWNGRIWERSEVKVRQEIHRMGAALMLSGSEDGRKASRGFTMRSNIDNLMVELKAVPSVHVDASEFDDRPDLLSFRNGTVDLRTGKLRPHDQGDMLTYRLDLDYRADAECPRWESFLGEIFPAHPELPDYIRRLVGYGITGHTSEQCFAVLWGKGANGKSVLTDTLTAVFRSVSKTTPFATFEEKPSGGIPNDVAALRGSRLVMASEGESGKPMSEAVLKRVTGKDMIAARFLRQEYFEFKPTFLLMLATNHKPRFKGQDEGLWRRVKMIPFQRYFAPNERDYGLDAKLLKESEGIAAWAVRGAVDWFRNGLQDPTVITSASKEYRETSDALAGFFPGILERDDSAQMNGGDAFNAYLEWTEAENLPMKERWTRRTFYDAMEERGAVRKKTMHGIALIGIRDASKSPAAVAGPGIFGN
jgi:putative DNA primase/helicase